MSTPGAVFDMDGLLVDSEPLWHEAEIEILGALGVPLIAEACRTTKGMFVGEVTAYWYERHPWRGPSPATVAVAIVDRVIELVEERPRPKPGARRAVETCASLGCPLVIASSSEHRLIDVVLRRHGLSDFFDLVCSAQDEPFGKPHPAVFLAAARKIGVAPESCVVFEDSPAGVVAAKAARMACVAVPEPEERGRPAFAIADVVLDSLEEVDAELVARLGASDRRL